MGFFSRLFGKREPSISIYEEQVHIVPVCTTNERMQWAIEKANATLHYFQDSLQSPRPNQQYFSVKVLIRDGDNHEHLWLTDPSFDDDGNLFGIVGNEPHYVGNKVRMNRKIGIGQEFLSDWMIIEDGRLIGGYTIRAIREEKPVHEWPEFDREIRLYIDEGIDHFKHDFATPEGAILCLEDAYDEQDIEKAIECKNFEEEARILLLKMNDRYSGRNALSATAEILCQSFRQYLEEEGFPSYKGVHRAFPERRKISDHLFLITEVCIFPDGAKLRQQIYTFKGENGWRVLNILD